MLKFLFLLTLSSNIALNTYSQSAKELKVELLESKNKYDSLLKEFYSQQTLLMTKITALETTLSKIKFVLGTVDAVEVKNSPLQQNSSLTNSLGANAEIISNAGKTQTSNTGTISKQGKGDGLTPTTGATIYTGSRGGRYYINKNGNKVYLKK